MTYTGLFSFLGSLNLVLAPLLMYLSYKAYHDSLAALESWKEAVAMGKKLSESYAMEQAILRNLVEEYDRKIREDLKCCGHSL
jgi:hypothetical protein